MVVNAKGDYLNRVIDSSENYWKGNSITLKDRHRPTTKYNITGVVRKNRFLLTKSVINFLIFIIKIRSTRLAIR